MPPPRQPQSLDPSLTRSGALSHPGSMAIGLFALLFGAYVFNLGGTQTTLNTLFDHGVEEVQAQNQAVVGFTLSAIPFALGAIACLAVFFLFLWIRHAAQAIRRSFYLRGRTVLDAQSFASLAARHDVSRKVAVNTWQRLRPFYNGQVRAHWDEDLRDTLHLRERDVDDLIARILHSSDRKPPLDEDYSRIRTVGQVMELVENAARYSVTESMMRKTHLAGPRPHRLAPADATSSKQPDLGETRMLLPLHKRKDLAAPATDADETLHPLHKRMN